MVVVKTNYPLGDFLIRVKNASRAGNKELTVPANKQISAVALALKKLEYIAEIKKDGDNLKISLVFRSKKPVLTDLKLVSKPGLRIYMTADDIGKRRGPSTYLISSAKGIISSREAIKERRGGEVIAEVW